MAGENVEIQVRISRHAAWDSIPLRFGKNVKDGSEGVFEGRELQAKAHSDGTWYDGELRLENSVTIEGKFLLGRAVEAGKRTVVTVLLPQEDPREYGAGVSKVVAGLREGGTIKPHEIAKKLHRPYVNGKIDTTDKLMQLLVDEGLIGAELRRRIEDREREIEQLRAEKVAAGENAEISPRIGVLQNVRIGKEPNRKGEEVCCAYLEFQEEDMPERKMYKWKDDETGWRKRVEDAKKLKGKRVVTKVWKPDTYPPLRWWRDIEEVPEGEE